MAIERYKVVIVGGGTGGISVAARLAHADVTSIAVVEPSADHFYQPLWTLVGAGEAKAGDTVRREASVMPKGVRWIQDAATAIDADAKVVELTGGGKVGYDFLVMAPGIQLDFGAIPGVEETLGRNGVSSNYRFDLAPRTWDFVKPLKGGTAIFMAPPGAIKCGGAPQKIAYLASDYWRRQGVLQDIHVIMALPSPKIFGVPVWADALMDVVADYGIDLRLSTEMVEIDPSRKEAVFVNHGDPAGEKYTVPYDMLHVVPPQSAPDWVKQSPLAAPDDPKGWISVDKTTLQHTRYPEVFALGDATSTPNAKTGAAVRKQAPVLVKNLLAVMDAKTPTAEYHGYGSCPLVTSNKSMLLAEFDYDAQPVPSFPMSYQSKPRYGMWLLKKHVLPQLYWHGMLKGRA